MTTTSEIGPATPASGVAGPAVSGVAGARRRSGLMGRLRADRGVGGGGAVMVGGVALTSVLNYGFGVALAWLLPQDEFGAASVIMNVLLLAAGVLSAGFPWVLARTLARLDVDHPSGRLDADATFRAALVGNLGLGVLLAGGVVVVQLVTGRVLPGAGWQLTLLVGSTILVSSLYTVLWGALHGTRQFDAIGITQLAETVVRVGAGLALVGLFGFGLRALAVVLLAGVAMAAWLSWRALGELFPRRGRIAGVRTFLAAVPIAGGTVSFGLLTTLDILVLSALSHGAGFGAVAVYQVASVLARASFMLSSTLSEAVFPFIAKAESPAEAHRRFMVGFRWVPVALVPIQLVMLLAPDAVLGIVFPAGYAAAADLIRVIGIGTIGLMVADMFLKALFARGLARPAAVGSLTAVAVQLVAMVVLVPRFGAVGAAISFAASAWTAAAGLGVVYLRHHPPGRVRARTALCWTASVAGLAATLLAATVVPRPLDLVVIAAGLLAYGVAAVGSGLVPSAYLARFRRRP